VKHVLALDQTKPSTDYPSMYCGTCAAVVTVPELGVIGACPYCKVPQRFAGPLWSEKAPLVVAATSMPRWKQ
jgi:uncharacterized CHY-type Zn-finger protein